MFKQTLSKITTELKNKHINSFNKKLLTREYLKGIQDDLYNIHGVRKSIEEIEKYLVSMKNSKSISDLILSSREVKRKITRSSPYQKAQIKCITNAFNNLYVEKLPLIKDASFCNLGAIQIENPNNMTRSLDLIIHNDFENFVYGKIISIYCCLKHLNNNGSGQDDQLNEVKILAQHSPVKGSGELIVAIFDGNYLTSVHMKEVRKLAKNKNFQIFNSTDIFIGDLKKKLLIK